MWTWLQNELGNDAWSRALVLLVDAGVKGMILLALAGLVVLAIRRASASARHLVWTLALAGLLLSPAVSLVMPMWQLPILPPADAPIGRAAQAARIPESEPQRNQVAAAEADGLITAVTPSPTPGRIGFEQAPAPSAPQVS